MATKKVNGITIAINADTNGVTAGLKDLTGDSIALSKQLKTVNSLLELDPTNTDLMATQQELLAKSVDTTRKRLEALKGAQEDVKAAVARGDIGTEEYIAFQRELVQTEHRLHDLEDQTDDTGEEVEDLSEDVEGAGTEMQKTEKKSGKLGEALKNGLAAGAKLAAAGIGAMTAAATAAVAGIIKASSETAEYGDNIDKMSQKLGMSSDAYQEWDFIMQHSGSDIDKMTTSMKKLADAVQDPSADAAAAFERLGISLEDAKNMSQEDLFASTITALQKLESGTERTSIANDLLGKSAMDLGALLNTSAEDTEAMRQQVHDLGGVMSEDAVKSAAAYQDSLQNVKTALSGMTRDIGSSFMPSMVKIMDSTADLATGNLDAIDGVEAGLDDFLQNLEKVADQIAEMAETFVPVIVDAISRALPRLMQSGVKIIRTLADAITKNLPMLLTAAGKIILDISTELLREMPKIIKIGFEIITSLAHGIADALPSMIPQIIGIVTEIVTILTNPETLGALIDAAFAIIDALIEGLLSEDSINKMVEMLPEVVTNIVDVLVSSVDKLLEAAEKIIKALCDYFFDQKNLDKIREAAGKILKKLGGALKDLVSNLLPFIRDVATAWAEMMIGEIDYDATALDIIKRLGAAFVRNFTHGFYNMGALMYDVMHPDGTPDVEGHYARGGIVTAPTRAMIGENGAEVILPLENNTRWMDILAAKIGGNGGVTIGEINVDVRGIDGVDDIGDTIVRKIDEALRIYQIGQMRGTGGTGWMDM